MVPALSRVRVLRQWGGIMDMRMDGSPIIAKTPVEGLYPQWRLVLWRLQGHPRLRLVLRLHHRARTSRIRSTRPSSLNRFRDGPH